MSDYRSESATGACRKRLISGIAGIAEEVEGITGVNDFGERWLVVKIGK
jgi:hypothetical protein